MPATKSIRKPSALEREAAKAKSQEDCYASLRRIAVHRAQRLLAALGDTPFVFRTEAREGDLLIVRICFEVLEVGQAQGAAQRATQVPIEIDTSELKHLDDAQIEALALFLGKAASALSLCPSVLGGDHFRAVTPSIRDYPRTLPNPGVAVFYDQSTALFLPMDDYNGATDTALADEIAGAATRRDPAFSTPTKRERTLDEHHNWAAAMTMAPPRPPRQLTFP